MIKSEKFISDEIPRRRGRPTGKNRIPLTLEERRARNAQYERERRTETAEAMNSLAEAAGCEPSISNAELLARVISQLQKASQRNSSDDLDELRRINENLMTQINSLEERLRNDHPRSEVKTEKQDDLNQQPEVMSLAPQICETSCKRMVTDEQCAINQTKQKINLPGKRCLSESSDYDGQIRKISKLKIIKSENGHSTQFRPEITTEDKQEIKIEKCEDNSSYRDSSRTVCIHSKVNGIVKPPEFETVQFAINTPAEPSIQEQGCQSFQSETHIPSIPYVQQNNSENQCEVQLDLFTDVEKRILSAWIENDDIFKTDDQSENIYKMKWFNDDCLEDYTS